MMSAMGENRQGDTRSVLVMPRLEKQVLIAPCCLQEGCRRFISHANGGTGVVVQTDMLTSVLTTENHRGGIVSLPCICHSKLEHSLI